MSASDSTRHDAAKRRALRAARAVTISFVALAAAGCAAMVTPLETDATHVADANVPEVAARDAATIVDAHDSPPAQDTAEAGHACSTDAGWEEYSRCCDENGWDWNLGCAAWGPFVPPEMNESEV
jgi:hypothetical protein